MAAASGIPGAGASSGRVVGDGVVADTTARSLFAAPVCMRLSGNRAASTAVKRTIAAAYGAMHFSLAPIKRSYARVARGAKRPPSRAIVVRCRPGDGNKRSYGARRTAREYSHTGRDHN